MRLNQLSKFKRFCNRKLLLKLVQINNMKILIIVAHPDDEVLGCGGAIASYTDQGHEVTSIIFTYGENSNLNESPRKLAKTRSSESIRAGKILGVKKMYFLGLPDNTLSEEIKDESLYKKLLTIIRERKPNIILTHSIDDYHPAHRNVAKLIKKLVSENKLKSRIYTFAIGIPIRAVQKNKPKLIIDTTRYQSKKKMALKQFKSQHWNFNYFGNLSKIKDYIYGIFHDKKSVEVFYKW
jgi:LmbE family N-acetylglucosaminyl deacetylase